MVFQAIFLLGAAIGRLSLCNWFARAARGLRQTCCASDGPYPLDEQVGGMHLLAARAAYLPQKWCINDRKMIEALIFNATRAGAVH